MNVIELRQYLTVPGRRDELIELFERAFLYLQEELGNHVIGTFRNLDDPDRFVWLRGFPDMAARAIALEAFYSHPVWRGHRDAANATILDSDNVLLLKPAWEGSGFANSVRTGTGVVIAQICHFALVPPADFVARFRSRADGLGAYVTEPSPNTFPRLPVREGEHVFVWFADAVTTLEMTEQLIKPVEVLRLEPTTRSQLR